MRLPLSHLLLSGLLLLGITASGARAQTDDPLEPQGLAGRAEFYLPGDPDEPVRLYFAEIPLDLSSLKFDPQAYRASLLSIYHAFAQEHGAQPHPQRLLGPPDPSRQRPTSIKKVFGKSLQDADAEIRRDALREVNSTLGAEMIEVEPTPEQRLEKFKMFFTEFSVDEDHFDPVVRRNLASLRHAIESGEEEFVYEKLTFREKIRSTKNFLREISQPSTDPEVAANLTKVAGIYVDKGELANGVVFASYRGVVTGNVLLMKGVAPEIAVSITTFQTLLTFAHATYGRHFSAMFNINSTFPGFRYNTNWVKLRKDFYYIWVGQLTQYLLGGMKWSYLASKQLRILFQNQFFGTIEHYWNAQPRDMALKGKAMPTKWFNRIGYVLITPWTTIETLEAIDGTLINLQMGNYEIYAIRWTTLVVAGSYYGLKQVLTHFPKEFERTTEWLESGEKRAIGWVMRTKNLVVDRCRRILGKPPLTRFDPPNRRADP